MRISKGQNVRHHISRYRIEKGGNNADDDESLGLASLLSCDPCCRLEMVGFGNPHYLLCKNIYPIIYTNLTP